MTNTSVPVWHHARYELPFVFTAGAAVSAGAAAAALVPVHEAAAARRLAIGGAAGKLAKAATALTAAGTGLLATHGGRSRRRGRRRRALARGCDLRAVGRLSRRVPVGGAGAGHGRAAARTDRRRSGATVAVAETPHPTDVEVSRSLNAVVVTLNDRRADEAEIDQLQRIVTGVLGGEPRIIVRGGDEVAVELTDRDGKVLATVARGGGRWVGERVGSPLSGGYVPSASGA